MSITYVCPPERFLAASWVITVWEGLATFDDEVNFIWTCVRRILPSETIWNVTPALH